MFLSQMTEAISIAGYDADVIRGAQRVIFEKYPRLFEDLLDQPLQTAQADPVIPNKVALAILEDLNVPPEVLELV